VALVQKLDGQSPEGGSKIRESVVQSKFLPVPRYVCTNPLKIWEYFLAYSTIISRQGAATCYQITLVKNINSTHRVEGIDTQFALSGALAANKVHKAGMGVKKGVEGPGDAKSELEAKVKGVLRS
jgi:hypothetical protein